MHKPIITIGINRSFHQRPCAEFLKFSHIPTTNATSYKTLEEETNFRYYGVCNYFN